MPQSSCTLLHALRKNLEPHFTWFLTTLEISHNSSHLSYSLSWSLECQNVNQIHVHYLSHPWLLCKHSLESLYSTGYRYKYNCIEYQLFFQEYEEHWTGELLLSIFFMLKCIQLLQLSFLLFYSIPNRLKSRLVFLIYIFVQRSTSFMTLK